MIYVIASSAYKYEKNRAEHESILKIGYSSDNKKTNEGRFSAYITQNPTCEILFTIEGGTVHDETDLHKYFDKYKKTFKGTRVREWFEDVPEIIEFFKTHTTIESIREEMTKTLNRSHKGINKRIKKDQYYSVFWPYIISVREVTGILDNSIYNECTSEPTEEYCIDWVNRHYLSQAEEILKYYNDLHSKLTLDMKTYIDHLRDTSSGQIHERLRELCETKDFTDEEKKIIAQQVSEKFDQFYNLLGPERCKACGYNITYIKNEINRLVFQDRVKMSDMIYHEFLVGKRYTKSFIKNKLKEIYISCGLSANPKATDLDSYFDLKSVQILRSDKKKDNGFEILSLKSLTS